MLCLPAEGKNDYGWVSTQELVDCTCNGCNGGLAKTGLGYWQKNGICYEGEYTYTAKTGTCQSSKCSHKGIGGLSTAKDEDGTILKGVASNFMAISIDAGGLNFMFYKNGTYGLDSEDNSDKVDCSKHKVNHAVTAVGAKGDNYHVKNSWGASWGDNGYFDMPAKINCLGVQKRQGIFPHA